MAIPNARLQELCAVFLYGGLADDVVNLARDWLTLQGLTSDVGGEPLTPISQWCHSNLRTWLLNELAVGGTPVTGTCPLRGRQGLDDIEIHTICGYITSQVDIIPDLLITESGVLIVTEDNQAICVE